MSDTKSTSETKDTTKEVSKSSTVTQGGSSNMTTGLVVLAVVIVAALVGGLYWFFGANTQVSTSNPVSALNAGVQSGIVDVSNAVDFSSFDENNPSESLNFGAIVTASENNPLAKLGQSNLDLAGKTVEQILQMDLSFTEPTGTEAIFNIDATIYQKFSDTFDYSKYNTTNYFEIIDFLQEITVDEFKELLGDFYLQMTIDIETGSEQVLIDVEITYLDEKVYIEILDFTSPDSSTAEIEQYIGQVVYFDASNIIDEYIEGVLSVYDQVPLDQVSFETQMEELLDQAIQDALAGGLALNEDMIQRVGNPIRNVITSNFSNWEMFTDLQEVDPIKETSNSTCQQGVFNLPGTVNVVESSLLQSLEIITADQDYVGPSFEQLQTSITDGLEDTSDLVNTLDFEWLFRGCTVGEETTGVGMTFNIDIPLSSSIALSFDTLIADLDSNFVIEAKDFDEDVTQQVEELFEQIDFNEVVQEGLNPTQPSNLFEIGSTPSESDGFLDSDFNSEFDSSDFEGGIFSLTDEEYDAYSSEFDVILDAYLNDEITADEYDQQIQELDARYGI